MTTLRDAGNSSAARSERSANLATALARWLRGGGVQNADGAYSGWLTADGSLSPPYPEITGYMLTFLAHESLDDTERHRADAAADWLVERVDRGDYSGRLDRAGVFLFDIGMITHGLLCYGQRSAHQRLLAAGRASAAFLIRNLFRFGAPRPMTGEVPPAGSSATWSNAGSAHLLKLVQALVNADVHGVVGAADAAERLVSPILSQQLASRSAPIETCPGSDVISLHAACYAAEGLWIWAAARRQPEARAYAARIVEWVWRQQLSDGGFTACAHRTGGPISERHQSDVLAQAVRLALLLGHRPERLDAAIGVLFRSVHERDGQAAVLYWPQVQQPHRNCWSSLFACQALRLRGDEPVLDWHELV